jgi:hypothetical protein
VHQTNKLLNTAQMAAQHLVYGQAAQSHGTQKNNPVHDANEASASPSVQTFSTDVIKPQLQQYSNMTFARKEQPMGNNTNRSYNGNGAPLTETERDFSSKMSNQIGVSAGHAQVTRPQPSASDRDSQSTRQMAVNLNRKFADTYTGRTQAGFHD